MAIDEREHLHGPKIMIHYQTSRKASIFKKNMHDQNSLKTI